MHYRIIAVLTAVVLLATLDVASAQVRPDHHARALDAREVAKRARVHRVYRFCNTWKCVKRVTHKRKARLVKKWIRTAASSAGWLKSTSWCESGSSGWYRLRTTGNGFWFALQFTVRTWASVGGRVIGGVPYGYWGEAVPSKAEQNYRAVLVLRAQGTGAWPVCGR